MPKIKIPNNRINSSAAWQTHEIWSKTIGNDPQPTENSESAPQEMRPTLNTYESYKGLLALARRNGGGLQTFDFRGTCKKCGGFGHLSFQCRNMLSSDTKESDSETSDDSESSEESSHKEYDTTTSTMDKSDKQNNTKNIKALRSTSPIRDRKLELSSSSSSKSSSNGNKNDTNLNERHRHRHHRHHHHHSHHQHPTKIAEGILSHSLEEHKKEAISSKLILSSESESEGKHRKRKKSKKERERKREKKHD